MKKIIFDCEYFSVKDTLECGQVFRFKPYKNGYKIYTLDKCAFCYNQGNNAVIECDDSDEQYFHNYFDLDRNYKSINDLALLEQSETLRIAANFGKGIRLLNQDKTETLFSFIISQNNNIPRIKGIIEKICTSLGEKREFLGEEYYSFPSAQKLSEQTEDFFKSIGLGYRAGYIKEVATKIAKGFNIDELSDLPTNKLKKELLSLHGVGPKVADCVALFGYKKSDSFPVDTWIEKVYRQDFGGLIKNREKISEWFVEKFKFNSGYYQQYLFFYKRELEK